jgi:CTP synthase
MSFLFTSSGILVPGGFGDRGTEGKIAAVQWARENKIPFLGICLGMQLAVVEFARNVMGLNKANSSEFDESTPDPVIMFMPEVSKTHLGGTMRLGSRPTFIQNPEKQEDIHIFKLYDNKTQILERHRHRYEVNPDYVEKFEEAGLCFIGRDETGKRMEIVHLRECEHPYFVGTQYHPEYQTRPLQPSPPFRGLILAAAGLLQTHFEQELKRSPLGRYDSTLDVRDEDIVAHLIAKSTISDAE